MDKDIFCKIIAKEVPADFVMEEKNWVAFKDIHPAAPVHILIVPRKHFVYLEDIDGNEKELLGELLLAVNQIAIKVGINQDGYRVVINQKDGGGQIIPHFHIHVMGGKKFDTHLSREATLLNK